MLASHILRPGKARRRVWTSCPEWACCMQKQGRLQENYSRGLTADFHAAECRWLRHGFAALREGCGPGPPRHDPIPFSLLGSDLLNGRTDRFAAPSHPKKDDSKLIRLYYRKIGRNRPFNPTIPFLEFVVTQ